jgi:proteasome lid subunit RPN8/RPN11
MMVHNHPSGDSSPSEADMRLTGHILGTDSAPIQIWKPQPDFVQQFSDESAAGAAGADVKVQNAVLEIPCEKTPRPKEPA